MTIFRNFKLFKEHETTMEPLQIMDEKIELLLDELKRINSAIVDAERKLEQVDYRHHSEGKLLSLKELLSVIQARIEGMGEFLNDCRTLARQRNRPKSEDIDIWI
jgi:hypothetical protein